MRVAIMLRAFFIVRGLMVAFDLVYLQNLEEQMALLSSGEATTVNINGKSYTVENLGALQKHYDWVQSKINEQTNGSMIPVSFVDKRRL